MRQLNRSKNTPIGTAFFLFLSLAIIPVTLKAAGLKLGLTPRLSAAIDIWAEVAETFGSNYGAGSGPELAALVIPDPSPQPAANDEPCPLQQRACVSEVEELSPVAAATPARLSKAAKSPRVECKLAAKARAANKPVDLAIGPAGITVRVDADARTARALNDRRVEATMRREVLNRLDRIMMPRGLDQPSISPVPKSFRMLFHMKQSATSSITGAECKARAALDAAVRLERASLNGSSTAPDNCDL